MKEEEKRRYTGEDFAPVYPLWLLFPITLLFLVILLWFKLVYRLKIIRDPELEKLPPGPAVYLGNHCSMLDFFFMSIAFYPRRIHYVMSNAFLSKWWGPPVIRGLQQIPKSQFFAEAKSVITMKRAVKKGCSIGIYPEGRISLTGRTGYIAPAIGKLVKSFEVPVIAVKEEGFSLRKPLWSKIRRRGDLQVECRLLFTHQEIQDLTAEEIHRRIVEALDYNDNERQLRKGLPFGKSRRLFGRAKLAEGLELILHRCPSCGRELVMESSGNRLFCGECGFGVTLDEYNRLTPERGGWPGESLTSIPDWYDWQAGVMRRRLAAPGYSFSSPGRLTLLAKNSFRAEEGGPVKVCLDAAGIWLEKDGVREKAHQTGEPGPGYWPAEQKETEAAGDRGADEDKVIRYFSAGQLPTVTGTLGCFVDFPGVDTLYRPEFNDRRLPVFWMQAVEALYAGKAENGAKGCPG